MIREETIRKNRELFEQARENMQSREGFVPWYPEAYIRAKELLNRREKREILQ